jgi:endonuclease YncB( thermonuclease family)
MNKKGWSRLLFAFASFVLLATIGPASGAGSRTVEGVVKKVADGDTVSLVSSEGAIFRVRLYGIDAPEIRHGRQPGQPHGADAKQALEGKVLLRNVLLEIRDVDRYKRRVGVLRIGARDVNAEMVREGWTWAYREYLNGPYASEYLDAERVARDNRLGLWLEYKPQPPWEFRKAMRRAGH